MTRLAGTMCAVLVAAGCALNAGNTRVDVALKIDEQAVDATLDAAVARIQAELQRRGLQVTVSAEADTARVVSTTRSGDRFTVILSRAPTAAGKEQTRVRVEWDKAPDRELWLGMLAAIASVTFEPQR